MKNKESPPETKKDKDYRKLTTRIALITSILIVIEKLITIIEKIIKLFD